MTLKRKLKICKTCQKESYLFSRGLCENCSKVKSINNLKAKKPKAKKLPTITSLKKNARYWFQRWIRLRDLGNKCIYNSCNNYLNDLKSFDAAHYLKAELYSNKVFDENNVHGSCKSCNFRDPTIDYRRGLLLKIGEEKLLQLEEEALVNRDGNFKWDRQMLLDTKEYYENKCKEIEGLNK